MGNYNKKGGVYLRTDKTYYSGGQQLTGTIYLQVLESIPLNTILLHIYGIQQCWWIQDQKQKIGQSFEGKHIIYNERFNIYLNKETLIHPGGYEFPFSLFLKHYLPGTFHQLSLKHKAKISYKLTVQCTNSLNQKLFQYEQQLVLREEAQIQHIMPAQILIRPKTFLFLRQGRCKVRCFFQKHVYLPGEDALIICQIDNLYCNLDVQKFDCVLCKYITLVSEDGKQKIIKQVVNQARITQIESGRIFKGEFAKKRLIKLYNKFQKKSLSPSTSGKLIKCEYLLEIQGTMIGCLCGQVIPTAFTKIQVISPPLIFQHIQQPKDWNPKIFQQKKLYNHQRQLQKNIKLDIVNKQIKEEDNEKIRGKLLNNI